MIAQWCPSVTIEQPAELNRTVLPPLEKRRRRHYALLLPLLTYIAICLVATSLGTDLKQGAPWNWTKAIGLAVVVPVVLLAVAEHSLRANGGKRRLKITESGLEFQPKPSRDGACLPWKAIRALEIEPLPGSPTLFRLVVRYGPRNFGWMIGIQSTEQRQALLRHISELQTARGLPSGLVVEFSRVPKRDALGPDVSLWFGVFALLLFTFGLPIAGSGIGSLVDEQKREEHRVRTQEETANLTKKLREAGAPQAESAWWQTVVREIVSGEKKLNRFGTAAILTLAGIGSTTMGLACLAGQMLWDRQAQLAWRLDMQADLQQGTP